MKKMKKLLTLSLAFMLILSFSSCDDDESLEFTLQPDPEGVSFVNSFSVEYVLTVETAGNIAERFVFNEIDLGTPTPITYQLQGAVSSDFVELTNLGETSSTEIAVTVGQLLSLAEEAGISNTPDEATGELTNTGSLFFRIRAFTGNDGANVVEQFSETQTLAVVIPEITAEEPIIPLLNLFLVGNATAADWENNNNNPPLIRNPDNETLYTYRAKFLGGDMAFKLLEIKGQWQPQWGTNDGITVEVNDGSGSDPGIFSVPTDGYYDFTIDLEANTFSITPFDETGATTYATIGYIGSARTGDDSGWSEDDDFTQSTFDPHIWFATGVTLFDGEMKFRPNNDWPGNWGSNTPISGFGTVDGPNIPVAAGTYDIWFNDLDGSYIFISIED